MKKKINFSDLGNRLAFAALEVLRKNDGSMSLGDLLTEVYNRKSADIPPEAREVYDSGGVRWKINTQFQSDIFVKAGFLRKTGGFVCYASHKYTKESGGAQDHQFRDQKRFLENFREHNNPRAACFAICDGAFYTEEKMRELESVTRKKPPISFAVHIEDVAENLQKLAALKDNSLQ